MARFCPAVLVALFAGFAAGSTPPPAVVSATAQAREHLAANAPADAVAVLERHLPFADGDKDFLDLLKKAYAAEARIATDPGRVADLRTKLALLGGNLEPSVAAPVPIAQTPAVVPAVTNDVLAQAAALFQEARAELFSSPKAEPRKFGMAAKLFQVAFMERVEMSADQQAAWAYCRVRVAADRLNRGADAATASEVIVDIEDALKLAPGHAGLQKVGGDVIAAAKQRGGVSARAVSPTPTPASVGSATIESANFRVTGTADAGFADAVSRAAEAKRDAIFSRWSGPAGGAWGPKCEIVIHRTAAEFSTVTKLPTTATGRAEVAMVGGKPSTRRIDLRADDPTLLDDALPRELTHIVLADLFWEKAPPAWAGLGMAVLAESPAEQDRYRRTLARCARSGELVSVEAMLTAAEPPSDRVTGFHVGSASLVGFLVKWKGEKAFTTFLRDSQRYGLNSALKRQYDVADATGLAAAWKRSELAPLAASP